MKICPAGAELFDVDRRMTTLIVALRTRLRLLHCIHTVFCLYLRMEIFALYSIN
jgi:hypothetical protein